MAFDQQMLEFVLAHRTGWATALSLGTMALGTSLTVQAFAAVVSVLFAVLVQAYRTAAAVAVGLVGSAVANALLKQVFERPRPPVTVALATAGGWAFPSTQAAETSAIAAALLVAVPWSNARTRWLGALVLAAGVAFVGACMVYLGAHWVTDVLAGWVLGGSLGAGAGLLFRKRPRRGAIQEEGNRSRSLRAEPRNPSA